MRKTIAWLLIAGTAAFVNLGMPISAQDSADTAKVADEGAATEKKDADPLLSAWETYQEKQKAFDEAYAQLNADYRAKKISLTDARAKLAKMQEELKPFKDAFVDALVEADVSKYADDENAEMLESGLFAMAQRHEEAEEYGSAVEAYEALLKYCSTSKSAGNVRSYYLPMALLGTGDLEKTVKRTSELVKEVDDNAKPGLLVRLGDFQAASGDSEAAVKSYDEAIKACGDEALGNRDPRARAQSDAKNRKQFIGQDAPNIDSETWIGGEAKSLADLKGNVVVLDFWATWCPPCRGAMPGLDEIYKEHKEEGVIALGVTHFYPYGFLPDDSSDLQKGKQVKPIAEEDYVDHVKKFKELSEISYPFVIGDDQDFKNYAIRGIPQMVVVDQQGKVALFIVGGGQDALVKACVENLLKNAKKADPETGK